MDPFFVHILRSFLWAKTQEKLTCISCPSFGIKPGRPDTESKPRRAHSNGKVNLFMMDGVPGIREPETSSEIHLKTESAQGKRQPKGVQKHSLSHTFTYAGGVFNQVLPGGKLGGCSYHHKSVMETFVGGSTSPNWINACLDWWMTSLRFFDPSCSIFGLSATLYN